MKLIITHEDISSPLLIKEKADYIPEIGDMVNLSVSESNPFREECKYPYMVKQRYAMIDEQGDDSVWVVLQGEIPKPQPIPQEDYDKFLEDCKRYKQAKAK